MYPCQSNSGLHERRTQRLCGGQQGGAAQGEAISHLPEEPGRPDRDRELDDDFEKIVDCDWICEVVKEDLKIKKAMNVSDALMEYFYKPTCNIDGLWSGYTVEKAMKTIVPDKAGAKVDMRLVPGQDAAKILIA
jgi:acetylornithine deacetylase/succinyl-diaminopimelate desuccinylase-like protein